MKRAIAAVFWVSLVGILLELFLALILGVKVYSHIVYVVISFALLGHGVGSTLFLILQSRLRPENDARILTGCLSWIALFSVMAANVLPGLPLDVEMLTDLTGMAMLFKANLLIALPFVGIGFLLSWIFTRHTEHAHRLYFWDLIGAGLGALLFFPLTTWLGPIPAISFLGVFTLGIAVSTMGLGGHAPWKIQTAGFVLATLVTWTTMMGGEPKYIPDTTFRWEWIPGRFKPEAYETRLQEWHTMGRTDLYRFVFRPLGLVLAESNRGPFQINLDPTPEVSYFTTNFRAGTPVYHLTQAGLAEHGSKIKLFSQAMEAPYLLLKDPKVFVIGTGGGRDIFMAKTHGATEVVGAEVNPATYKAMARGGVAFEYSDGIYESAGVQVFNVDGRHLAKRQAHEKFDLVVLNGVDTFSALSSGAYAFAENFLYTKDAVRDFVRIIKPDGIVNFNRIFERDLPRETMRLFVMVIDALEAEGFKDPWNNVIVGNHKDWGIFLVKKGAFTDAEQAKVAEYFKERQTQRVYFPRGAEDPSVASPFFDYVTALRAGSAAGFIDEYPADISVVTDDSPFFYKYYRFMVDRRKINTHPTSGTTAFYVQALIIAQALGFILLFILAPLVFFARRGVSVLPARALAPFFTYFAMLGIGFIFIEIALMQSLTLLLGSPLYSVSISLVTILIASGVGSFKAGVLEDGRGLSIARAGVATAVLVVLLALVGRFGAGISQLAAGAPFLVRVTVSALVLAPIGFLLGMFFPTGLKLISGKYSGATAWAWGLNASFTVLGSTTAIIVAQFQGFASVLMWAAGAYVLAVGALWGLKRSIGGVVQ